MLVLWRAYFARPTGAAIRGRYTRVALVVPVLVVEDLVLWVEVPSSIKVSLVDYFKIFFRH